VTFNHEVTEHYPDEPVWVVVLEDKPHLASIRPPLA
jgi:hypothetical protein